MKRTSLVLVAALACTLLVGGNGAVFGDEPNRNPEREAGPRDGARERENVPAGRKDREARTKDHHRLTFVAGPVRSEQDAARLKAAVAGVRGLGEITLRGGTERGTVLISVTASNEAGLRQALNAARSAGFGVRPVAQGKGRTESESPERGPGDGEGRPEGFGPRDGERPRGSVGPRDGEGAKRRGPRDGEGPQKEGPRDGEGARKAGPREGDGPQKTGPRDGEAPRKAGPRDGEGPRKTGPRDGEETRGSAFLVGPVRSMQEAVRLRQMLLQVQGMREVVVRPGEKLNTALVTLFVDQKDAITRATRVMQGARLEARPVPGPRKEGHARERGEGGPREEGGTHRISPEGRGQRPGGERER